MFKQYVGHLPSHDPLHHYLQHEILPQIGLQDHCAKFRVFRMGGSNEVYLYEEKYSHVQVVGKFFARNGHASSHVSAKDQRMEQEFHNLHLMRSYGLVGYPHDVVRPLGYNGWLNSLLVEEYRGGQSLSSVITSAIFSQQPDMLYEKLTALAYFLATFHNRTANGCGVNFNEDCAYLDRLVGKLFKKQFIHWDEVQEFSWLCERWREQPRMWEDQQVLVHGDATPSNFLFGHGLSVSGDYGYRKPDPRLFQKALDTLQIRPEQALFLGNDLYHDIFGAQQVGLKAILVASNPVNTSHQTVTPDYTIARFADLPQAVSYFATLE